MQRQYRGALLARQSSTKIGNKNQNTEAGHKPITYLKCVRECTYVCVYEAEIATASPSCYCGRHLRDGTACLWGAF